MIPMSDWFGYGFVHVLQHGCLTHWYVRCGLSWYGACLLHVSLICGL